jgi:hypothetical protein
MAHLWGELIAPAIEGRPLSSSYFVQPFTKLIAALPGGQLAATQALPANILHGPLIVHALRVSR